nr:MAG TPA: hypothetical protein [Bacteriophage sp.]
MSFVLFLYKQVPSKDSSSTSSTGPIVFVISSSSSSSLFPASLSFSCFRLRIAALYANTHRAI